MLPWCWCFPSAVKGKTPAVASLIAMAGIRAYFEVCSEQRSCSSVSSFWLNKQKSLWYIFRNWSSSVPRDHDRPHDKDTEVMGRNDNDLVGGSRGFWCWRWNCIRKSQHTLMRSPKTLMTSASERSRNNQECEKKHIPSQHTNTLMQEKSSRFCLFACRTKLFTEKPKGWGSWKGFLGGTVSHVAIISEVNIRLFCVQLKDGGCRCLSFVFRSLKHHEKCFSLKSLLTVGSFFTVKQRSCTSLEQHGTQKGLRHVL